jgi:hypothetical protein
MTADEKRNRQFEEQHIAQLEKAVAQIEEQWPRAVERAKQMPEGALRSGWTLQLEVLMQDRESVLCQAGVDPARIKTPREAHKAEKALPGHVRHGFRRAERLHEHMKKAVAERRARHMESQAAT